MQSMWTAVSDRDYYGYNEELEEPEFCVDCGAREPETCERWCSSRALAGEPVPTDATDPDDGVHVTILMAAASPGSPVPRRNAMSLAE